MAVTTEMKWFEIWIEDRRSMSETMLRNMIADLEAGYNPNGHSIRKQAVDIEEYNMATNRNMDRFKVMEDKDVNRWCYYDLRKRGVIE